MERDRPAPFHPAPENTLPHTPAPDRCFTPETRSPDGPGDLPVPPSPLPPHQVIFCAADVSSNGIADQEAPSGIPSGSTSTPNRQVDFPQVRELFDEQLKRYQQMKRRLHRSTNGKAGDGTEDVRLAPEAGEPPASAEPSREPSYPTPFGTLSFQELRERTRKYAAYALHHTYQVNAADVDDGLQAGYLRLWERLQSQPELLEDKSLAWMGKGIIYQALHATRGDWQFRRRTAPDPEGTLDVGSRPAKVEFKAHSGETRQVDMRTDLHRAIQTIAERILTHEAGKRGDHDLWALYGLTMLQTSASEVSRLFGVREQSMQAAYQRVRGWLQEALPNYKPPGAIKLVRQHGRMALPRQDMTAIRNNNGDVPHTVYEAVESLIQTMKADTWQQDMLALDGIRRAVPAQTQARAHGLSTSRMQRAYTRVHLMIGAQCDPSVRVRRPERRVKSVFTLTDETAAAIEQLALEFLKHPKSYEKLVALHAHISNLAISTTAKHFNIPTSTLRYYAQQIGTRLGTPTKPAREA
jgi:DNA-directed RNA polymerase specialized sigma24 family protein